MSKEVYNEGDLVEAVKGELRHTDRLVASAVSCPLGLLYLPGFQQGTYVDALVADGFTITVIEKAKPQLPTEPGIYVSWVNAPSPEIVHLTKSSGWVDANDENYMGVNELAKLMPLTRLAPVAETAKNVLERVANFWEFPSQSVTEELNAIAIEYGIGA